jgi:predicted regulator of Ras-like GTPase activity (Roadblock/LC7/MglB family)
MASKEEKLNEPLDDLDDVQGIKGAAVVRRDGLLIASNLGSDIDDDQVGAMTASTVGSGETASEALNMGDVDEVTIESDDGKLVATGAGDQGILAILTEPDVNMGLVKVEMGNATEKVKRVL